MIVRRACLGVAAPPTRACHSLGEVCSARRLPMSASIRWVLVGLLLSTATCATAAPRRVALCFFGLTRSLDYTIDSIRHSILDPLLLNDVETTLFLHTYNATSVTNWRSAEDAATMDWTAYKLLHPHEWQVDDVAVVNKLIETDLKAWLKHGDAWAGETAEHTTLRNFLKQLYSLKQVTNMWIQEASRLDIVFYLRSDVWFFNQLDVAELDEAVQHPKRIYTPMFHQWGGLNDRLAFGTPESMAIYGNRLDAAMDFAQQEALHAEHLLLNITTTAGLDTTCRTKLLFERVRATGELWGIPSGKAVSGDDNIFNFRPGLRVTRDQFGKIEFVPL